ncbi:hypothetical protein BJY27_009568 [Streptomyces rapamycinicus]|uniref:Uncharacterized protein n=1 Tax=Streptomyces rapamycinicus TaxID=1226757 RepID=A0ABR6M2J5_9ACTN|nr:hypothetical protein [Streptomyces rapamycinicus]
MHYAVSRQLPLPRALGPVSGSHPRRRTGYGLDTGRG